MAWRHLAVGLVLVLLVAIPAVAQEDEETAVPETSTEPTEEAVEPTALPSEEPTAVPTATTTPFPVVTPTPPIGGSPTPGATATPGAGAGAILLADNFDNPASGWLPRSATQPGQRLSYVDGEYMVQKDPEAAAVFIQLPGAYPDASMGVDVRLIGSDSDLGVQLWCRFQREPPVRAYAFVLRPDLRSFRLARLDPGSSVVLADWQPSASILRGNETNRVELRCAGSTISATVNGVPVVSVSDSTYQGGGFALVVAAAGSAADVRLDNLIVTQR